MSKSRRQPRPPGRIDRRAFLKAASLGVAAGAGAAVLGAGTAPALAAETAPRDKARGRYRNTAHVRRAYDLARF